MVAVFLAPGFEEMEALTPVDMLRRADVKTVMVGIGGLEITGSHGVRVLCDITAEELDPDAPDMIVLPGGQPGADNLAASPVVEKCLESCTAAGRWIAAICAAPYILGQRGLLDGRRATCFPGYESHFPTGCYTGAPVEKDGHIITARGPGVAMDFGAALVEALCGPQEAQKVLMAMQVK